jgi:hypothetical protein
MQEAVKKSLITGYNTGTNFLVILNDKILDTIVPPDITIETIHIWQL